MKKLYTLTNSARFDDTPRIKVNFYDGIPPEDENGYCNDPTKIENWGANAIGGHCSALDQGYELFGQKTTNYQKACNLRSKNK